MMKRPQRRGQVNFIGLDLAWGSLDPAKKPNRTGMAVLDGDGGLTFVGSAVADADIQRALAPYLRDPCVVAIDAPLLVTNPKGMRQAEAEINAIFHGFDAGAHSANIERFSANPRGARMASTMDLDIDPTSTSPRRAVEVYPHPATVALFRLGRIFKYKKGAPDERRPEFIKLIEAIESLADSAVPMHVTDSDDWQRLRRQVSEAQRPYELNLFEDQLDAVLCAYIALYATRCPDDVVIYGDFPANGYILTPKLPPDVKPAPREAKSSATTILKPQPLATIQSGLPIAEIASRLQQLQAQFPDAEVRRGRANRWELWPRVDDATSG